MSSIIRVMKCMFGQPNFEAPYVDMTGKTVLITGPSKGGIGYESALQLAKRGANLILASRNILKGQDAVDSIKQELSATEQTEPEEDRVTCFECDVSSLQSVRQFCSQIKNHESISKIDVIILNAGAEFSDYAETTDNVERTFATCVLGHHLMIYELDELIQDRIIWLTGDIYCTASGQSWPTLEDKSTSGAQCYAKASLGRLLISKHLHSIDKSKNIIVVHPGIVASTKLDNTMFKYFGSALLINTHFGAQSSIHIAGLEASELHQDRDVPYYHNKYGWFTLADNDLAMDTDAAKALFEECDKICDIQR